MAVLCGMSTIQYSARSARNYIIYCLSPFRYAAVLTFVVLVSRHFDHNPTSSGRDHIDRQRYEYEMACRVTRERESDVTEDLYKVSCTERTGQGVDFELVPMVKWKLDIP